MYNSRAMVEGEFKTNLKRLRIQRGLTQEELADQLSVSRTLITKWETGKAAITEDSLSRLCDFFGVNRKELIGENVQSIEVETGKEHAKVLFYAYLISAVIAAAASAFLWFRFASSLIDLGRAADKGRWDFVTILLLVTVALMTAFLLFALFKVFRIAKKEKLFRTKAKTQG